MKPKRYWAWFIAHRLLRFVAGIICKVDVSEVTPIPSTGPVVTLCNHVNFIDPVLALTIRDRYIRGMTAVETYRRFLFNVVAWAAEAIPVERGTPDRSAIRACVETLDNGWGLYVAPEGTRSHHGRLQEGKAGVTLILLRAGTHIPIYPIAIAGAEHFWSNFKRLRRTPVRIVSGKPFYLAPPSGRVSREVREQMVAEMMGQIAALLPPENRGVYADQVGKIPQYLDFTPPADAA
jgi:1-acyl-sn-glycerol-3-phosphate acyltransferase